MQSNADHLAERAGDTDALEVIAKPSLPLIIARVRDGEPFNANDLVGDLARKRGWLVPAYSLPPANEDQRIIRILVKINQTRELADALADDMRDSIIDLRKKAAGEAVRQPVHEGHGY
jgi:glutamate decarboxylase